MDISQYYNTFVNNIKATTLLEYIAVVAGIISVWYSKKENVLVYPIGLINTIAYMYISAKGHLFGEVTVNTYYTVMSVIGWLAWNKKVANTGQKTLQITTASTKEWVQHLTFFTICFLAIYASLIYLQKSFYTVIPLPDALASATAFTGMWLMVRKKLESWYWWIVSNLFAIPLYFVKNYMLTAVYYLILLVLAILGYIEWKRKLQAKIRQVVN